MTIADTIPRPRRGQAAPIGFVVRAPNAGQRPPHCRRAGSEAADRHCRRAG
jgi:hypothetical protein